MAVNPEKEKAIELAMGAVERQFGKGSIMRLGKDEPLIRDIQVISTGSISLDIALGVGGVPGAASWRSTAGVLGQDHPLLHVVAEAQKKGGICGYIDAEHALDVGYARKLGVRTDDLLLSQPTPASRGWRSPRCWSAPGPSTSWSSIRWPPSSPRRSSRARWVMPTWASRPGS
jgi:recombination protein RecA